MTDEQYIQQLEEELDYQKQLANQGTQSTASNILAYNREDNLIKWQLDLAEEMERVEHLLRGHQIKTDEKGNISYSEPKDPNLKPFNEYGVQLLLNVISFYLNRNTILSNYDEDTIKWKVYDFGLELTDLIFLKYDEMMITIDWKSEIEKQIGYKIIELPNGKYVTKIRYKDGKIKYEEIDDNILKFRNEIITFHLQQKIKLYPIIVREIVDTVHSAYLRALGGGERDSLRTARTVSQNEPLNQMQNLNAIAPQRKFSLLKPSSWLRA